MRKVKPDFEKFLIDEFYKQYQGNDDDSWEKFESWLQELNTEDWINFGNEYAKSFRKNLK